MIYKKYGKKYIIDKDKLRKLRKKHYSTQKKFVTKLNMIDDFSISLSTYKAIESRENYLVKDTYIHIFCLTFGISFQELILEEGNLELMKKDETIEELEDKINKLEQQLISLQDDNVIIPKKDIIKYLLQNNKISITNNS